MFRPRKKIFFAQDHAAIRWRDKAAILSRAVVRGHSCPTILLRREISHLRGRPGCCEPVWQARGHGHRGRRGEVERMNPGTAQSPARERMRLLQTPQPRMKAED